MKKPENKNLNTTLSFLPKKAIFVWRIRATLMLIIFSFLFGCLYVFFKNLALILYALGIIVYFVFILIYFPLLYKNYYYNIIDNYIIIEKGIITKQVSHISISKIQYVEILSDPLNKLFKLNTIVLHTAGSRKAITPIDISESNRIKQIIESAYEKK